MKTFLHKHPALSYFLMVFAISWGGKKTYEEFRFGIIKGHLLQDEHGNFKKANGNRWSGKSMQALPGSTATR